MKIRIQEITDGYEAKVMAALQPIFNGPSNIKGKEFWFCRPDGPDVTKDLVYVGSDYSLQHLINVVASCLYTGTESLCVAAEMTALASRTPLTSPPIPKNRITLSISSVSKEYEGKVKAAMKSVFNEPPMTSGDYFVFGRADKQKIDMDFSEVKDEHDFESLIVYVADRLYKGEEFHFILKEMRHRALKAISDKQLKKYQEEILDRPREEYKRKSSDMYRDEIMNVPRKEPYYLQSASRYVDKKDLAFMAPYDYFGAGWDTIAKDAISQLKHISSSNNNNYADLSTEAPRVVKGARRTAHPIYGGFCEARVPDRQARNPKGAHQDGSGTGKGEIQKPGIPF